MMNTRERRDRSERRKQRLWSVWYGSFKPRRRAPSRRSGDARFYAIDWYSPHLLAVAMGIALLCVADAFLTLLLLSNGAVEVNPIMAALLYRGAAAFMAAKMAVTATGILALVVLSRYRFMRVLPVGAILYLLLGAYIWLIGYEISLVKGHFDLVNLQYY